MNFSKIIIPTIFFSLFLSVLSAVTFADEVKEPSLKGPSGVNVQVNSEELEPFSIDKKTEPEDKLVFYSDQNTSVDINDSGEPNLNMRF